MGGTAVAAPYVQRLHLPSTQQSALQQQSSSQPVGQQQPSLQQQQHDSAAWVAAFLSTENGNTVRKIEKKVIESRVAPWRPIHHSHEGRV